MDELSLQVLASHEPERGARVVTPEIKAATELRLHFIRAACERRWQEAAWINGVRTGRIDG